MSKRPPLDLMALTAEQAIPMPEAMQRAAVSVEPVAKPKKLPKAITEAAQVRTEDLKPLAFKVPPAFCKRFKHAALSADLKLNELLFEAFAAWEEKQKRKS